MNLADGLMKRLINFCGAARISQLHLADIAIRCNPHMQHRGISAISGLVLQTILELIDQLTLNMLPIKNKGIAATAP